MSVTGLQQRARLFASRLETLAGALPGDRVGKTLLREAAAIAAKCESVHRAKSADALVNSVRALQDQIRTSLQWLDIAGESPLMTRALIVELMAEGRALIALTKAIAEGGGVGDVVPPPQPPNSGGSRAR